MILINTIDEKFFTLDGVRFARIYQPLAQGSEAIGIYSIYDQKQRLVNSTKYDEFSIDGSTYASQELTIQALLNVIYSAVSDYDVEQLSNRVDNLEENQYSGVVVYETLAELPATGTLLVSYKVSNDSTPSNNGYYHWSGSAYVKDASLAEGVIEYGDIDPVSGGTVKEYIDRNNQENSELFQGSKIVIADSGATLTTGSYINTSGVVTANASFGYFEYLLTEGEVIGLIANDGVSARAAVVVDSEGNVTKIAEDSEALFSMIANASDYKLYCNVLLTNIEDLIVYSYVDNGVSEKILNERFGELYKIKLFRSDILTIGGFYHADTDAFNSSANWASSELISIEEKYPVEIMTSVSTTFVGAMQFYDENEDFIDAALLDSSNTLGDFRIVEIVIPYGAKFYRLCSYSAAGLDSFYLKYRDNSEQFVDSKKVLDYDYLCVPVGGQSLSIGAEGTPILSTGAKYANMFMTDEGILNNQKAVADFTSLYAMKEETAETICSGMAESIIEFMNAEEVVESNYIFGSHGSGGITIQTFIDTYFAGFKNAIEGAYNIATAEGKTFNVPVWCWLQGESDLRGVDGTSKQDKASYKTALSGLIDDVNTFVKALTGQTNDPICLIYQSSNVSLYEQVFPFAPPAGEDRTGVVTAQYEISSERDDAILVNAGYMMTFQNTANIHMNSIGYKWLGAMFGNVYKRMIKDGNKPVFDINSSEIDAVNNIVKLKYNVPSPPLVIDETSVRTVANYGFNIIDSGDNELITSIEVLFDEIWIYCSSDPTGAKLRYGINGEADTHTDSGIEYVTGNSGRRTGARGNIRDSKGDKDKFEINGVEYRLDSWHPYFEIQL